MRNPILFGEYETKELIDFPIKGSDLDRLDFISKTLIPKDRIFDITRTSISARHNIGIISFKNYQIEIMPKLLKKTSDVESTQVLKNLMYMLSYTHNLNIKNSEISLFGNESGEFLEVFISIFASRLSALLKKTVPRRYVSVDECLGVVRGKILVAQSQIANLRNVTNVVCRYDEFSENNDLAKLFKYVAFRLIKVSRQNKNRKLLSLILNSLEFVDNEVFDLQRVERIVLGRNESSFKEILNLSKLFISGHRMSFKGRDQDHVAIIFNMNDLFEEFIFEVIRRNTQRLGIKKIHPQKGKRLVKGYGSLDASKTDWNEADTLFNTFTDIIIEFDPAKVRDGVSNLLIIDTKYKLLNESGKNHYNIQNTDVYQIMTYKLLHRADSTLPHVALLYPEGTAPVNLAFKLNSTLPETFFALTVNLKINLQKEIDSLVSNLHERFDSILSIEI